MKTTDLSGQWKVTLKGNITYSVRLPGTLDENGIGFKDINANQWKPADVSEEVNESNILLQPSDIITTRLTRAYTYEGVAVYRREFTYPEQERKQRVFLDIERTRKLTLMINGHRVSPYVAGTLSTPYVYEITKYVTRDNIIELICDNSYQEWPRGAILYSCAASDETQTNWNGILGYLRLREEREDFITGIRVYPHEGKLTVKVGFDATSPYEGTLCVTSPLLEVNIEQQIAIDAGKHTITIDDIKIGDHCMYWDEYEGNLYELSVSGDCLESKTVSFGIRDFKQTDKGRLSLNGRTIFLRGETNCCVFPETGHMPVVQKEWERVLKIYQSYGINCVRFHSHCPPEAAFAAADQLGIMMQAELSHWDPNSALESEESFCYYRLELEQILFTYANHPSFVMLTLGNELAAKELGHRRMTELIHVARSMDPSRMYANGSNVHFGERGADPNSDFYTTSSYYQKMIRGTSSPMIGHINQAYPNSKTTYDQVMSEIRTEYMGPVFSFEVGQYEILPDFDEIHDFHGVTIPNNLSYIKNRVEQRGCYPDWKKRVEATGELARIAYREEIEAVLRTKELSGISLLGLQDFPGQGTALMGMLNSHLQAKPYAFSQAENFKKFFREVLPLLLLEKYTYSNQETLLADVEIANYGKRDMVAATNYELKNGKELVAKGSLPVSTMPCGELTILGSICISLGDIKSPVKLKLTVSVEEIENDYPIWVYPDTMLSIPEEILITRTYEETIRELEKGKRVLYSPASEEAYFPNSVQAQFSTDFWSVGTFANQSGCMGCLMDPTHPVFMKFPTEFHSNWQWWPMSMGRAIVLPDEIDPIITVMDCYARLRRMAFLIEGKVGSGKLMISSMGLLEKQEYPEVRALMNSILSYMASSEFEPRQEISLEQLQGIIR